MPTFGYTGTTESDRANLTGVITAIYSQMGANNGIAQSITINAKNWDTGSGADDHTIKCALYNASKNLVGSTEAKLIVGEVYASYTLNFAEPKPSLIANQYYYICAWSNQPGNGQGVVNMTGGEGFGPTYYELKDYDAAGGIYPASVTLSNSTADYWLNIYCTYLYADNQDITMTGNMGLMGQITCKQT